MSEGNNYNKYRKRSTLTSACDVLSSLLQSRKSPLSDQFLRWKLWQKWSEVVGPTMASQCQPVGYTDGTLLVWVEHPVYMQQLTFLVKEIQNKVNSYVDKNWVKRIRFTLDRKVVLGNQQVREDLEKCLSSASPNEDEDPQHVQYHQKER